MINKWSAIGRITVVCLMLPFAAQAQDLSVVVIPDTQWYAENNPEIIEAQIDWIVTNEVAENIVYVVHLGDLKDGQTCDNDTINVGTGGGRSEWQIVSDAFADLETAGIPYGVVPGNHDFDSLNPGMMSETCPNWTNQRPLSLFNMNFGPTRFSMQPWYGDPSVPTQGNRVTSSNEDNFTLFGFGGVNFIAINLAYRQAANELNPVSMTCNNSEVPWANNLLATYSDRLGIITTHYFLDENPGDAFGPYGQCVYDGLSGNPNLFLMLSAHERGEAWRVDTSGRGGMQPVHALLADYQDVLYPTAPINFDSLPTAAPNVGGNSGFMRIMRFNSTTGMVNVTTFAPEVPSLGRMSDLVSDYDIPADGTTMDEGTASNISFSYLGYVTIATTPTFDIFECDGVSGGTCTTPIGTIAFPGDSGTQTDGTGLSLTYTCSGTFCDSAGYGANDIQNVDWTIDAGSGEITALTMRLDTDPGCLALTSPLPCSQSTVNFTFISTGLTGNTASGGSCQMGPTCISGIAINGANLFVPL